MMIKPKPTIEKIVIPEDKKQELDTILNSKYARHSKTRAIAEIAGGLCHGCGQIPTKILKYKLEGASLIERYCDKCLSKIS